MLIIRGICLLLFYIYSRTFLLDYTYAMAYSTTTLRAVPSLKETM